MLGKLGFVLCVTGQTCWYEFPSVCHMKLAILLRRLISSGATTTARSLGSESPRSAAATATANAAAHATPSAAMACRILLPIPRTQPRKAASCTAFLLFARKERKKKIIRAGGQARLRNHGIETPSLRLGIEETYEGRRGSPRLDGS